MNPEDLNLLERAVLEQMAQGQLAYARVTSRSWIGPGFYTYLEAPHDVVQPLRPRRPMPAFRANVQGRNRPIADLLDVGRPSAWEG